MTDERILKDSISEALLRQAVIECFDLELEQLKNESEPITFSKRHEKRMQALFKSERRKSTAKARKAIFKRAASIAAIISIFICAAFMSMPKVRAAARETLISWYSKYVKFDFGQTPQALAVWSLSYVPEGFVEIQIFQDTSISFIVYANDAGERFNVTAIPSDGAMSVNNENVEYSQVLKKGIVYHTFKALTPETYSCVLWDNEGYRFSVSGRLSIDELLRIAEAVIRG